MKPYLLAAALVLAGAAAAQERNPAHPVEPYETPQAEEDPSTVHFVDRSEWVLALRIVNPEMEPLGRIRDLAAERDGRIVYAALHLETGKFAPDKLLAVPWHCLWLDYDDNRAVLDVPLDQLMAAEGFDGKAWPLRAELVCENPLAKRQREREVPETGAGYGGDEAVEASAPAPEPTEVHQVKNLIRHRIETPTGERLGFIEDVAIDTGAGRISYFALRVATTNAANKLVAVPWPALKFLDDPDEEQPRLVMTLSQEQIEGAPPFYPEKKHWGEMSEPGWVKRLYEYYGYTPYWTPRVPEPPAPPPTPPPPGTPPAGGSRGG
jgi:sporulation protein YlmC with PRC-barrel domain